MNVLGQAGATRPANALVVYRPIKARSRLIARVLTIARAALLIWGGASLAGVSAAAIVYGQGGLDAYLRPAVAPGPTPSSTADLRAKVAAPPLAARLNAPRPVNPQPAASPAAAALQPPAASLAFLAASERPPPAPPPGAGMIDASPLAPAEPLVAARLPPARPTEPVITGTVGRPRYASNAPRRFRRLRDAPFLYRRTRNREDFPPYEDYRASPPSFHDW